MRLKKYEILKVLGSLALIVSIYNANASCWGFFDQPEIPSKVKALRKF